MEKSNIIIVEDNNALAAELACYLEKDQISVRIVDCGEDLDIALSKKKADILIIDLNLPYEDGLSITTRIRRAYPDIGILVLTARVRNIDRQTAYEAGADVFLTKPAKPLEISKIMFNLHRRLKQQPLEPKTKDHWILNKTTFCLHSPANAQINLKSSEVQLLHTMVLSDNFIEFSRLIELFGELDAPLTVNKIRLEQMVSRLRHKLKPFVLHNNSIKSIRGSGYQLCIPLSINE